MYTTTVKRTIAQLVKFCRCSIFIAICLESVYVKVVHSYRFLPWPSCCKQASFPQHLRFAYLMRRNAKRKPKQNASSPKHHSCTHALIHSSYCLLIPSPTLSSRPLLTQKNTNSSSLHPKPPTSTSLTLFSNASGPQTNTIASPSPYSFRTQCSLNSGSAIRPLSPSQPSGGCVSVCRILHLSG